MGCRKTKHATADLALAEIAAMRARSAEPSDRLVRLTWYWCDQCLAYHIGHDDEKEENEG